jgi:hypothetical protein
MKTFILFVIQIIVIAISVSLSSCRKEPITTGEVAIIIWANGSSTGVRAYEKYNNDSCVKYTDLNWQVKDTCGVFKIKLPHRIR